VGIAEVSWTVLLGLLLVLALLGLFGWWRVRLVRQGGVEVAMRARPDLVGSRWHIGVGRYRGDKFVWYRVTSLITGPNEVVSRAGLRIVHRRRPTGSESYVMPGGALVLRCRARDREFEIAMAPDALTGFLSWLEAAPPGSAVPWAS
jgi:Protein of unknown function (DUF2550)